MFYRTELKLLRETFKKCHFQTLIVTDLQTADYKIDMGLIQLLGKEEAYRNYFGGLLADMLPNTVYRLKDSFFRNYIFLLLPDLSEKSILAIGPYIEKTYSRNEILEIAEKLGAAPQLIPPLVNYYGSLPILDDGSPLFAMLDSFSEDIWQGADNFKVVDIGHQAPEVPLMIRNEGAASDPEQTALNMQLMEKRYEFENELMQAVAKGQLHKTEFMLSKVTAMSFEKRLADPLREVKNYCIVMNTLLRKAAESGGVHPIHLNMISSEFAKKIEKLSTAQSVESFMSEIFRAYCRLVKNHSSKKYSPMIQKVITVVDYDISANLTLNTLAAMLNINASYLSSRFRKETGVTLTDYVHQKRIEQAKRLLKTSNLQIQTVAQYCGILDLHYFSKLFKKYTGLTPKEYREENNIR